MIADIFAWIFLGLLAGGLAKFLIPGKDPGGCLVTIVIGIVGALVGGFLGKNLLGSDLTAGSVINWNNFGLATLGSIVLLLLFRLLKK